MADVVDYKIHGDDMQIVEVELDPKEGVRAEAGAMMFMSDWNADFHRRGVQRTQANADRREFFHNHLSQQWAGQKTGCLRGSLSR